MTDAPDARPFRNYSPVRVEVPETAFEVVSQDGRVFYDLGVLTRHLDQHFKAAGLAVAIMGTDSDCARALGALDAVDVLRALNDGLTEWSLTN